MTKIKFRIATWKKLILIARGFGWITKDSREVKGFARGNMRIVAKRIDGKWKVDVFSGRSLIEANILSDRNARITVSQFLAIGTGTEGWH